MECREVRVLSIKKKKKKHYEMYTCIAELLCCTAEMTVTL